MEFQASVNQKEFVLRAWEKGKRTFWHSWILCGGNTSLPYFLVLSSSAQESAAQFTEMEKLEREVASV